MRRAAAILPSSRANVPPKSLVLELPQCHPSQHSFVYAFEENPGVRFVVAAAGTKTGKTVGACIRVVKEAWDGFAGKLIWWLAPSYSQSENAYTQIKRILPKGTFKEEKAKLALQLINPNGGEHSRIEFKSGEKSDNLRGFGVHFLVIDEFARIKRDAVISAMTTQLKTMGSAMYLSTPRGHDYFWEEFKKGDKSRILAGQPDPHPEYLSFTMPSWVNPYLPAESIDDMRRNMPADVFAQEVEAKFIDGATSVFRGAHDCVKGLGFTEPEHGKRYVIGVDLARVRDFSVITVVDALTKHVVYWDRFHDNSWDYQVAKIIAVSKKYFGATVVVDATAIGEAPAQKLAEYVSTIPYKINSNQAKRELIEKLRLSIEQRQISYPPIKQLIDELDDFELQLTPSGTVVYGAPRGKFDDCLPAGTWIRTKRGMVPIEEVIVGDKVLTHKGRYRSVTRIGNRQANDLHCITATGRLPLTLTSNHKFLSYKKTFDYASKKNTLKYIDTDWRSVDEVPNLMKYATVSPVPTTVQDKETVDLLPFCPETYKDVRGKLQAYTYVRDNADKGRTRLNCKQNYLSRFLAVDSQFCWLLGYFAAEGSTGRHNVSFASHLNEAPFREYLKSYTDRLGLTLSIHQTSEYGVVSSFGSVPLNAFFKTFGKHNNKHLPDWVCELPPTKQKYILMGYFLGDGCFIDGKLSAVSISPTLACQLWEMLLRLGFPVSIRKQPGRNGHHTQYVLSLDRRSADKFKALIPPVFLNCKKKAKSSFKQIQTQLRFKDGNLVGSIRKVEPVHGQHTVYNLEVEEDNSYVANFSTVHNCVISLSLANWQLSQVPFKYSFKRVRL